MKKILFLIINLMLLCQTINAQYWASKDCPRDELMGTPDMKCYKWIDAGNGSLSFDTSKDNIFTIATEDGVFDTIGLFGTHQRYISMGVIGLYDASNNLIEKIEIAFEIFDGNKVYPNKYTKMGGNNLKRSKKVLDHIKTSNGYIRAIIPLTNGANFDITVKSIKIN